MTPLLPRPGDIDIGVGPYFTTPGLASVLPVGWLKPPDVRLAHIRAFVAIAGRECIIPAAFMVMPDRSLSLSVHTEHGRELWPVAAVLYDVQ